MNTQERKPARAAAAPTAPARLPVEEQDRVVKPKARAASTAMADDAVLEGVRRVAGVVLDVQTAGDAQLAGEVVGLDQLGEAGVQVRLVRDVGGDGQQRRVAPDVVGAGLDPLPQALRVAARQVVGDFERPETLLAGEDRAEREALAALAAGQRGGGAESRRWAVSCGAAVCTAMEARPFLLIFLAAHLATRRNWHLPQPGASRARVASWRQDRLEGCRGFNGPFPSAPLDERYGAGPWTRAFVPRHPGMRGHPRCSRL